MLVEVSNSPFSACFQSFAVSISFPVLSSSLVLVYYRRLALPSAAHPLSHYTLFTGTGTPLHLTLNVFILLASRDDIHHVACIYLRLAWHCP